jgi:hypothetical protein
MIWASLWPFVLFVIGVVVVIWATERLLEGLVGLAGLLCDALAVFLAWRVF